MALLWHGHGLGYGSRGGAVATRPLSARAAPREPSHARTGSGRSPHLVWKVRHAFWPRKHPVDERTQPPSDRAA